MARSYCSVEDVKRFLPVNIIPQTITPLNPNPRNPAPFTITDNDIEYYIQQACSRIDAILGTQYDVPLKQINIGGEITYPYPIPNIAAIWACQLIFEQRLQGAEKADSEAQKRREEWADKELMLLQNGERRLQGQRPTRGSRFIRGTLFDIPRNPATDHKSSGQGR